MLTDASNACSSFSATRAGPSPCPHIRRTPEPLEAPPVDPLFAQIAHEARSLLKHPGSRGKECQYLPRASPPFCLRFPSALPFSDPLPPDLTYRPLPTLPFSRVKAADEAQKAAVMQRQSGLLMSATTCPIAPCRTS
jgi:hypothetical protein